MMAMGERHETYRDEYLTFAEAKRRMGISNRAVRRAVAALPAELRAAVILSEYEDKSHAEIGAIVRATPKAVETRLYRARLHLRKVLARYLAA